MCLDLCYVITLPSRMCVLPCYFCSATPILTCFPIHHTSATRDAVKHYEDRRVHAHTLPLDHYGATDVSHKGVEWTYGGDLNRRVHSITYGPLDQYLSTDCACDTVCP